MRRFVLTAIGKDQPGIVSAVTEVLYKTKCNIEDSSMTILEGEFAIIMIAKPQSKLTLAELEKYFLPVEKKLALHVHLRELPSPQKAASKVSRGEAPHMISLLGTDRPGLVYHVTSLLAKRGINITDVSTKIIGDAKKPVYAMLIEVELSKSVDREKLGRELAQLANRLRAEIALKPVEMYQC